MGVILVQALIDGLLVGGVYAAIGLGLSLAYGVMGVVNWAHGDLLMVAMFLSFYLSKLGGWDPYATIIINVVVLGAVGYLLQKFAFNKMMNRSDKAWRDIMLFTCGMSIFLQALFNMIFGAPAKSLNTKYDGMFYIGNVMVSIPKTISFVIAAIICILLFFLIMRTEMGRSLRATSQDRSTAQLMGINANRVYCICFAISLAVVGVAASLLVPFYSITPYVGAAFTFKAFIIVALGGKGDIIGAMQAGILIGILEKICSVLWGDAVAQILIFVMFILILLVLPNGLAGLRKKEGAAL